ncbi:hypothetical protein QYF36_018088 [Acer negundo]|nr:hypothetical protein QYF36_018088 [Acer negundo]
MAMSRCGNANIVNGTNYMKSDEKSHHHHHGSGSPYHTVAHFSFFPRCRRWPSSLTHLTYSFLPGTRADAMEPVAKAFLTWQGTHTSHSQELQIPQILTSRSVSVIVIMEMGSRLRARSNTSSCICTHRWKVSL